MPSIRYKMVKTLFKVIGVNKMLDKQGEDFEKLLAEYDALLGRYGICAGGEGSPAGIF